MVWNRSHTILLTALITDAVLYLKISDESYKTYGTQLFLMALAFVALLITVAGFVSLIRDIDLAVTTKKQEKNFLSKSYFYLKITLGVLFVFLGLFGIYGIVIDPPSLHDKGTWIWIIIFIGFFFRMGSVFILGAYRKLKDE